MKATKRIINNYETGDKFTFHTGLRTRKTLVFPDDKDAVELQKPTVGDVKVPMVFPGRTGTVELKLDASELWGNELYVNYDRLKFNKVFRFSVDEI